MLTSLYASSEPQISGLPDAFALNHVTQAAAHVVIGGHLRCIARAHSEESIACSQGRLQHGLAASADNVVCLISKTFASSA